MDPRTAIANACGLLRKAVKTEYATEKNELIVRAVYELLKAEGSVFVDGPGSPTIVFAAGDDAYRACLTYRGEAYVCVDVDCREARAGIEAGHVPSNWRQAITLTA